MDVLLAVRTLSRIWYCFPMLVAWELVWLVWLGAQQAVAQLGDSTWTDFFVETSKDPTRSNRRDTSCISNLKLICQTATSLTTYPCLLSCRSCKVSSAEALG